ncbi:hypothetical protein RI129_001027 [Pyrocoelia pectoralis]|uniref:Acyl-coenzyme A thioesterase 13 n=1 Tax=Pyrocoelia pectoralis TaxID=417401 RepID=A0AAN7VUF2_9COLE
MRQIGTQEIRKIFKSNECGFDNVLQKMKIIEAGDGKCIGEMVVEEQHTNKNKTLHGGMISTLIDTVTTLALFTHKNSELVLSVSVDLHITFIKGAKMGEEIVICASTTKAGRTLGFTNCLIKSKNTDEFLAVGNHTKFLLRKKKE